MSTHFSCTQCGRCCRDLRLPLSLDEAAAWLRGGGEVQLFSEAIPWPVEPPDDDLPAAHKKRRSFAAASGALPVRVVVSLVAAFDGPCPHLLDDLRCGNYAQRPRVCRIYPAEINPFVALEPSGKGCPPEAWSPVHPVLADSRGYLDPELVETIAAFRATDAHEAEARGALCALLGFESAALANEGYAIFVPGSEALSAALDALTHADVAALAAQASSWTFVSNRRNTLDTLCSIDALQQSAGALTDARLHYLGFHAADAD